MRIPHYNHLGANFQNGIDVIEQAYIISNKALRDQKYLCFAKLEALRRGEVVEGCDFDPDNPSVDTLIEYEIANIALSNQYLRHSISMMIYHHWEKQIVFWNGKKFQTKKGEISLHLLYLKFLREKEIQADEEKMGIINMVVNFVKHGSNWNHLSELSGGIPKSENSWEDQLKICRPDFFVTEPLVAPSRSRDPYDYFVLTHEHMLEFFEAIRNSGPHSGSVVQITAGV